MPDDQGKPTSPKDARIRGAIEAGAPSVSATLRVIPADSIKIEESPTLKYLGRKLSSIPI